MAGTYTDIIVVTAPDSAPVGSIVDVEVRIKNIGAFSFFITATGRVGTGLGLQFGDTNQNVGTGDEAVFTDSFAMPNQQVVVTVWSWYWSAEGWVQDDVGSVTVVIGAGPATRAAAITTKILRVDPTVFSGYDTPFPASDVPVGSRIKLKIGIENTGEDTFEIGFRYVITDPGNNTETETAWKNLAAGGIHTFIQPTFQGWPVELAGTWHVLLELIDSYGTVYDSFNGVLFTTVGTVGGEPDLLTDVKLLVSDITGTVSIPAVGLTVNQRFQIMASGLNPGPGPANMGLTWQIVKPDGGILSGVRHESIWTNEGNIQQFIEPSIGSITIDQEGEWSMSLELLRGADDTVIDTWQGVILDAGAAPPGGFGGIGDIFSIIPLMVMMMMMSMMMNMMSDPRGFGAAAVEKGRPFVQIFTTPTKTGKVLKGIEGVGGLFPSKPKQ